jgi:hypothetical protein
MLERDIELKIKKASKDRDILVFKWPPTYEKGVPDRIFMTKGGYSFYVEFKKEDGKPRKKQQYIINKMLKNNIDVSVVSSIEEGIKLLEEKKDYIRNIKCQ